MKEILSALKEIGIISGGAIKDLQAAKFGFEMLLNCHKKRKNLAEHHSVPLTWMLGHSDRLRKAVSRSRPQAKNAYRRSDRTLHTELHCIAWA